MENNINGSELLTAAAFAAIDSRHQSQCKGRRWRKFWSRLWCFGSKQNTKRITPAFVASETNATTNQSEISSNTNQPATSISIAAPPSSPASFLNSANPSTVQSPAGFRSFSMSACLYSPTTPTSNMFKIGPYAHETQLVSPPVFSTMTTEPSTAPLTPPSESLHLTTPPSPEVPFAHFFAHLDLSTTDKGNGITFYSPLTSPCSVASKDLHTLYQFYPGSPASHLISPKSGVTRSGTSSPFLESELSARWSTSFCNQDANFPRCDSSNVENMLWKRASFSKNDAGFSQHDVNYAEQGKCMNWYGTEDGVEQYNSFSQLNICGPMGIRQRNEESEQMTCIGASGELSSLVEDKHVKYNTGGQFVHRRESSEFQSSSSEIELYATQQSLANHSDDHPSAGYGEFKFDNVKNPDNPNSLKRPWTQNREDLNTEDAIAQWRFFHMRTSGIS